MRVHGSWEFFPLQQTTFRKSFCFYFPCVFNFSGQCPDGLCSCSLSLFQAGDLSDLPDPEEVADALVAITDGAAETLDKITEWEASNGVEA